MSLFNADEVPNPLETLVGEDKKFKTVEDLARGKIEADAFIEQLKTETAAERTAREKAELELEIYRRNSNLAPPATPASEQKPAAEAPSQTDIRALVLELTNEARQQEQTKANLKEAESKLIAAAGSSENAVRIVKDKATELGVTPEWLEDMAARSPSGFLKLIGVSDNNAKATPGPSQGDVSPRALESGNLKAGTYAYYENIRKTNKSLYFSPQIQNQLQRDALAAAQRGENFFA